MKETITVHIGEGTTLDGGPFNNCIVDWVGEERVHVNDRHDGHSGQNITLEDLQHIVKDEIQSDEPFKIEGVDPHTDEYAGAIEVPLVDGFDVMVNGELMTAESIREGNMQPKEDTRISIFPA